MEAARRLVRSADVKDAGIHYLEYESLHFTTHAGRLWKVYGSPVCQSSKTPLAILTMHKATPVHAKGSFQYSTVDEADSKLFSNVGDHIGLK